MQHSGLEVWRAWPFKSENRAFIRPSVVWQSSQQTSLQIVRAQPQYFSSVQTERGGMFPPSLLHTRATWRRGVEGYEGRGLWTPRNNSSDPRLGTAGLCMIFLFRTKAYTNFSDRQTTEDHHFIIDVVVSCFQTSTTFCCMEGLSAEQTYYTK